MIPIEHLIWDWNGTLLDDIDASIYALNQMCLSRELPIITREAYRNHFGFPVRDYYHYLGFQFDNDEYDLMSEEFHRHFFASGLLRLRPETKPVLEQLSGMVRSQSILSAAEHTMLQQMTEEAGIQRYFRHILGAGNLHGTSKEEQAHTLAKYLSADPARVLLIGDTLHDAEVAQACGFQCVLLCTGHQSPSKLRTAEVPMIETLSLVPLLPNYTYDSCQKIST